MSVGPAAVTTAPAVTPVFEAGIGGAAAFNAASGVNVVVPVIEWAVVQQGTQVDFRNSLTGKFTVIQPTFIGGQFTLTIDYDAANPIFGTTIKLFVNQLMTNVLLQRDVGGSGYVIPNAVITQIDDNVRIEGKPAIRISARISGSYSVT